ncbi:MAG: FHA domain-containing protein [Planctomycetota bacterium]
MNATLFVVRADGASQEIIIRQDRVVVGRDKSAHLRVPARSVSRQHCEIVAEDGRLVVRDLGSSNGTFVNRERVEEAELGAGDLVSVGPAVFAVKIDGEPSDLDGADVYARGSVELADDAPAKPTYPGGAAAAAAALAGGGGGGADSDDSDLAMGALTDNSDDSSVLDFDFDLGDDEEDDQPGL